MDGKERGGGQGTEDGIEGKRWMGQKEGIKVNTNCDSYTSTMLT
jgi:hypothetical protein